MTRTPAFTLWTVARVLAIPFIREQRRIADLLETLGLTQSIEHPSFNYFKPYATLLSCTTSGTTMYVLMAIASNDRENPGKLILATLNFPNNPNCDGPADANDFTIVMFRRRDTLDDALSGLPDGLAENLATSAHEIAEAIVARHRAGVQRAYDFGIADCNRAQSWLGEDTEGV